MPNTCKRPRNLDDEFAVVEDHIFNTPIESIAQAAIILLLLPCNPKTERAI